VPLEPEEPELPVEPVLPDEVGSVPLVLWAVLPLESGVGASLE
jgi:hypothetical protein